MTTTDLPDITDKNIFQMISLILVEDFIKASF